MKIISGSVRGKALKSPEGIDTRPTTNRVKESIFNIIQFDIVSAKVLDLFAGSGQMGLEAISRGAESAVFVDNDTKAFRTLSENVKICGFEKSAKLQNSNFENYIKSTKDKFDIIFLDPPYGGEVLENALNLIEVFDILSNGGIIICESAFVDQFKVPESLTLSKTYKYGTIKITKLVK